ncbi:MAG: sigma 54-interacting transcriptional regulator [bacterium]
MPRKIIGSSGKIVVTLSKKGVFFTENHYNFFPMPKMGEQIGGYKIDALLGEGGIGKVYRGERSGKVYALKFLEAPLQEEALRSFKQEVRFLSHLSHPNLIKINDFLESSSPEIKPFFVMEYLSGLPLNALPASTPFSLWLEIFVKTCLGLHYLHTRNILHHDLKPSNLFFSEGQGVKILDFSLASTFEKGESEGGPKGTLPYLPPEAFSGYYEKRSDLFSLAVVFYQLLTGHFPYSKILSPRHLEALPPAKPAHAWRPEVPEYFSNLLQEMLSLSPHERPASVWTILQYLKQHTDLEIRLEEESLGQVFEKTPYVGREKEMSEAAAWLDAPAVSSRFFVLSGPTGVGRSRFLEEIRWKSLMQSGTFVTLTDEEAADWKGMLALKLGLGKGTERNDLLSFSKSFFEKTKGTKAVFALQDLHRWPPAALEELKTFLHSLSRQSSDSKIILEFNEDFTSEESLFGKMENALRIRLQDLPRPETDLLLQKSLTGFSLSPSELNDIGRRSGGRPWLAFALLQERLSNKRGDSLSLSKGFEDSVRSRLSQLSPAAQALLALLVSHPENVDMTEAESLWENTPSPLLSTLLELDEKGWVSFKKNHGTVLFLKQASLKTIIQGAISPDLLLQSHLRWIRFLKLEILKEGKAAPATLALVNHALAAKDREVLTRHGLSALTLLDSQGLHEKAVEWSSRLLEIVDEVSFHCHLHAHRAPLFYKLGRYEESLRSYEEWYKRRQDDDTQLQKVKFHFYSGLVFFAWKKDKEAREALEKSLTTGNAALHETLRPYHTRALLLLASLFENAGDFDGSRDTLEKALALKVNDAGLRGEIEQRFGELELHQLRLESSRAHLEKSLEEYGLTHNAQKIAMAHNALATLFKEWGLLGKARQEAQKAVEWAERGGEHVQRARYEGNRGLILGESGHYGEGIEAMERSKEILDVLGNVQERTVLEFQRLQLYLWLGNLDRVRALLEKLIGEKERLKTIGYWPFLLAARAEAAFLCGDLDAAQNFYTHAWENEKIDAGPLRLQIGLHLFKIRYLRERELSPRLPEFRGLLELLSSFPKSAPHPFTLLLKFIDGPPGGHGKEELNILLQTVSRTESFETRMDFCALLESYFKRHSLERLASFVGDQRRKEWERAFQALPEELKMDFEKNRGLYDLDQALEKPVEKKTSAPAAEALPAAPKNPPGDGKITENRFRQFCEISNQIAQKTDLGEILESTMDAAILITGAERGFLILKGEDGKNANIPGYEVRVARHLTKNALESDEFQLSWSIVKKALTEGSPVHTDNALEEENFRDLKSVHAFQLRSIVAIPLETGGKVLGVIYLDNRYHTHLFQPADLVILSGFANQVGAAIQKQQMLEELQKVKAQLENKVEAQEQRIVVLSEELTQSRQNLKYEYREIIGSSPAMMQVFKLLDHVSKTKIPVWILGESGTGKELVARSLHENSPRKSGPFVAENCSSIPENLLESELFGHKKGSFTHADRDRVGLFEQSHGGTLFLDEVADMSLAMQAKLLRVLQEEEIRPIGSNKKIKIDVRLVTASNRDLAKMVEKGTFREDLFYRINGMTIPLPPLRERREDIPALVHYLMKRISKSYELPICKIGQEALEFMMNQNWPGNIRQLEGVIRNSMMFADGKTITAKILQSNGLLQNRASPSSSSPTPLHNPEDEGERASLIECLKRNHLDKKLVAKELGITPKSVYMRMAKYGLPKKNSLLVKFLDELS